LRVVIAGRTERRLRAIAAGIHEAGGTVLTKVTDATQEKDVVALLDKADAKCAVELVVYNVGNNISAPALDTMSELFERL
jgi:short-subunit dehydrogenase